ncbi:hypothetical protein HK105_206174 [Polyrhizophydium stewartii]|uniref:ATP synthase F0 subunit 8 n=1 Tax=Polyrhizophydium stewartii TaxID=2732419 RepID=A0ABR4N3Z6_9FUNG
MNGPTTGWYIHLAWLAAVGIIILVVWCVLESRRRRKLLSMGGPVDPEVAAGVLLYPPPASRPVQPQAGVPAAGGLPPYSLQPEPPFTPAPSAPPAPASTTFGGRP